MSEQKWLAIGDSLTWWRDSYADKLEIDFLAKPGVTVLGWKLGLPTDLHEEGYTDALVFLGTNDAHPAFDASVPAYLVGQAALREKLEAQGMTVHYVAPPLVTYDDGVATRIREYGEALMDLCETGQAASCLDLYPLVKSEHLWDRTHPNAEGHEIITVAISETFGIPYREPPGYEPPVLAVVMGMLIGALVVGAIWAWSTRKKAEPSL